LVDAAKEYGFRLVERTQNRVVVIDPQGRQMVYNPLNVLTFTSERKRCVPAAVVYLTSLNFIWAL
jgi:hypothetical protein